MGTVPSANEAFVIISYFCGSERSCSALCLFFRLLTVSLNLHSSSDRTMIDVSQFKIAPPHKQGCCDSRHLRKKQFNGALLPMEWQRLNLSSFKSEVCSLVLCTLKYSPCLFLTLWWIFQNNVAACTACASYCHSFNEAQCLLDLLQTLLMVETVLSKIWP